MKVIQIMPEFGLAGAETMCENLSYELMKRGENVIVISLYTYHSAITERLEQNGIKVLYLNKKAGLDLSMIRKLIKIFKSEKPDVIHTHRYVMQYAIPAAIITGVKHRIHTVHNVAKKENTKVARQLNYLFYKFAHVIPVALSPEIQRTIEIEYKLSIDKIPVVYNGIDLLKCIQKDNYGFSDKIKILHIGRFSEQKNHEGLIDAFERVHKDYPNTVLQLIGEGEKKDEIIKKIKDMKLSDCVEILGMQSTVYTFLNKADIFVLPSNYEGIPMTLIEAMATGLPIVATNVGGVPDMLNNQEDAFVVTNACDSIVDAIEQLIRDATLREKFGRNAISKSNRFSSITMAEEYFDIYRCT